MDDIARNCLSVVMPCYNEAATVEVAIKRVLESPYTGELIVVDDGSTDATPAILSQLSDPRLRVISQPANRGKGAALRRGFAEVTRPFVIVQDADEEYDPADYDDVLAPLLTGKADVVYGSRFQAAQAHRVLYFWHSMGNRLLTLLSNMFTDLNLTDVETCYKAFRREVLETFEIEEDRFGFEIEVTCKLAQGRWRIYEVGISYAGRTYEEGKKIGWKDGFRALYCILRYSGFSRRRRERRADALQPAPLEDPSGSLTGTLDNLDDARNYAEWIYSLMEPHLGSRLIEIGAGHGTFTELLADGRTVTATELSPRCCAVLRDRYASTPEVEVVECDILHSPTLGPFENAVLVNVLEHVEDDRKALAALRDALEPGGRVILFVPAFQALYSEFDRQIGHHRRYKKRGLTSAIEAAGLSVVEIRYVNSVGALAWWILARQLGQVPTKRWATTAYDRAVVPGLRRLESRWRPPFGQSIFCVAERPPDAGPSSHSARSLATPPGGGPEWGVADETRGQAPRAGARRR